MQKFFKLSSKCHASVGGVAVAAAATTVLCMKTSKSNSNNNCNNVICNPVVAASKFSSMSFCEEGNKEALNPKEWRGFSVTSVESLTPNTKRIRFGFEDKNQRMGLPVASCLMARAEVDGENVARPYTPVTSNEQQGYMELVVKGYDAGKLSKHLVNLQPGDVLEMKGPFIKYAYEANMKKEIGMIAGGSGITPMLQVVNHILRNPNDRTKVHLLFANVTEEDIILRDEIDALVHLYPEQLKVTYCLDKPSEKWDGCSGYITKDMIQKYMPVPDENNLICVCGPPALMYHISGNKAKNKSQGELDGLLRDLKYTSSMVFKF